jgi:GNAT superfamily N-acetyltransferase
VNIVERNESLDLVRDSLAELPYYALPAGYAVRWFGPGDEALWVQVYGAAERYFEVTQELWRREFGHDIEALAERQFFLVDERREAIATATAWWDDDYDGGAWGRVHWVAVVPERQGRGLAKPLMTVVCCRLRDLGHTRACLTTSTGRVRAVNLYRKFGFVPNIRSEEERAVWEALAPWLSEPLDLPKG